MVEIKRFDIFLVNLDPTLGAEMKKTRPCVIISPDELNQHLSTAIIAPMTTVSRGQYVSRIDMTFKGKEGQVALDQLRSVAKERLVEKLGIVQNPTAREISRVLTEMFAY